jgi:hypothetical protein
VWLGCLLCAVISILGIIYFRTKGPTPARVGVECADWQRLHPRWIWCDDFENDADIPRDYFDYDRGASQLAVIKDQSYRGDASLKQSFLTTQIGAGHVRRGFGRSPLPRGSQNNPSEDFQEVYWRFFIRHQSPWEDGSEAGVGTGTSKLTRATVFATGDTGAGWIPAMHAPLWSGTPHNLSLDPQRCVNDGSGTVCADGSTLHCASYNDFDKMCFEGESIGAIPLTGGADVGRWHCVEAHVKLNTPGSADGTFEDWIDDALDSRDTTINWRGSYSAYGINAISLEGYWDAGSGHAPANESRWIDNFVISRDRIGCTVP